MSIQKKKPWKRTGLSRRVLLALGELTPKEGDSATADEILSRLGPSDREITRGAVWVILDRAVKNGLVRSNRIDEDSKKPYRYELTAGGERRVKWIKGKLKMRLPKPELRAVANPVEEEE